MGINAGQTFWHAIKNEICPLGGSVGGGCFIYHGAPYPNFFWIAAPQSTQQSIVNNTFTSHENHEAYVETQIPCGDWFVPTAQELSDIYPGCAYWVHDGSRYWASDHLNEVTPQFRCWIQMGTGQIGVYGGNSNTTYRVRAFRKVSY
jgi:hypothetical protein